MLVKHHEDARFFVTGDAGKDYLVDISANYGRGWCGCAHYQFVIQKDISKGEVGAQCKHMRAVFAWLGAKVARQLYDQTKTTKANPFD